MLDYSGLDIVANPMLIGLGTAVKSGNTINVPPAVVELLRGGEDPAKVLAGLRVIDIGTPAVEPLMMRPISLIPRE